MARIEQAKRIVVKVGSSLLIGDDNLDRKEWLSTLVSDIAALNRAGTEVIIVTSGAVALGRHPLNYGKRQLTLEEKQAAAACGQISLIALWAEKFSAPGVNLYPAQILLTADDSINRRRYLNARNTLETLLANKHVIPVINENDTVATAELRFGDNDRLAARVAQMVSADLLVLLSDIDGLYSADPRSDPSAQFIPEVHGITADIEAMAGSVGSAVGSGGMRTKIEAAKIALAAGCHMVIRKGLRNHPLSALATGERETWFISDATPLSARKNWISGSLHPAGTITVDEGAATALKSGKSLLPAGVCRVEGMFERGDAVLIKDVSGRVLGKGLAAYGAADAERIAGQQSQKIEEILGFKGRSALVHRDDMVLDQ